MGRSILLDSAFKGRVELFSFLLQTGADPDIRCIRGRSLSDYIKMDFSESLSNGEFFVKTQFIINQLNKMLYKFTLTTPMRGLATQAQRRN